MPVLQYYSLLGHHTSQIYLCDLSSSDWDDVVVTKAGTAVTLHCNDTALRGPVNVNWKVQLPGTDNWKLVLFASDRTGFSGASLKTSMRLVDANFRDSGVFSLSLQPETEDGGFYSCMIEQRQRRLKERIILLAILTGTKISAPLHQNRPSTVPSPHELTINVPCTSPLVSSQRGPRRAHSSGQHPAARRQSSSRLCRQQDPLGEASCCYFHEVRDAAKDGNRCQVAAGSA